MLQKTLLLCLISLLLLHCSPKETKDVKDGAITSSTSGGNQVYNYSNKLEFETFQSLNLDETHANLLDSQVAKESHQEVIDAWVALHTDIGAFITEKDFSWNASDSTIKVFHKIYFDSTGHMKHHFINVVTPSVSSGKKEAFSKLMKEFGSSYQVALKRATPFAQCGKIQYVN